MDEETLQKLKDGIIDINTLSYDELQEANRLLEEEISREYARLQKKRQENAALEKEISRIMPVLEKLKKKVMEKYGISEEEVNEYLEKVQVPKHPESPSQWSQNLLTALEGFDSDWKKKKEEQ